MSDALVLPVRAEQLKVLGTVVLRIPVSMMDNLTGLKQAAKLLLHHQPMLPHVAMAVSVRVIRPQHQPVTTLMQEPSTLPARVRLAPIATF